MFIRFFELPNKFCYVSNPKLKNVEQKLSSGFENSTKYSIKLSSKNF